MTNDLREIIRMDIRAKDELIKLLEQQREELVRKLNTSYSYK